MFSKRMNGKHTYVTRIEPFLLLCLFCLEQYAFGGVYLASPKSVYLGAACVTNKERERHQRDFTSLFEAIEFPEAYRITYLAGSIAGPAYDVIKRDLGIIRAEYVLLACLAHFDEMKAQDVADISRRPRNTVSRAVHRMVAEGYIERTPDIKDGRQARLKITQAGRALHLKAAEKLKSRQDLVLDLLDSEERKSFSDLLLKLAVGASGLYDR